MVHAMKPFKIILWWKTCCAKKFRMVDRRRRLGYNIL